MIRQFVAIRVLPATSLAGRNVSSGNMYLRVRGVMRLFALMICFLLLSPTVRADQTFSFYNGSRNKVYTVTTHAIGPIWSWGGHWQYEPSVVALTSTSYVMLFASNTTAGSGSGESIFMATSSDGIS